MNPVDGDLPEQVTIWRCAECGKWSHAKRRPAWHRRTITELVDAWGLPFDESQRYGETDREDGRSHSDPLEQSAHWELPTLEAEEGGFYTATITNMHGDPEPDERYSPATAVVKCGPFVEYTAYLKAQWNKDPKAKDHAWSLSAEAAADERTWPVVATAHATDLDRDLADVPF